MFATILSLLLSGCSNEHHNNLIAHWKHPPVIEICAEVPLDEDFILDQFDWWYNEISDVYNYEEVIYNSCFEDIENDTIRIQKAYQEDLEIIGAAAYTFLMYKGFDYDPHMQYAKINLQASNNERHIRHEIGHAFGWGHFKNPEHLMHSIGMGDNACELGKYPLMK